MKIYTVVANTEEGDGEFDKTLGVADSLDNAEVLIDECCSKINAEYTVEEREINTTKILHEFYYNSEGEFVDEIKL